MNKLLLFSLTLVLFSCSGINVFPFGSKCVVALQGSELVEANADYGNDTSVWFFQKDAVVIRVITPTVLNQADNLAHAITIGIYQLANPDVFAREISTQSGLKRLLLLENLDKSILQYDSRSLQPRSSTDFNIARAEGAKYIAIIAGYASLTTDRVVRLVQIPLIKISKSKLNPINWINFGSKPKPGELNILLRLGNNQIDTVVINLKDECT